MNIGDLVKDEWGEIAMVMSRVGFIKGRWRIRYLTTGGKATCWEQSLYPLAPSETQKKVSKKT